MKKHRHGFTLAEVLITLVIIGIIAAMTIPTLMNKTNEQETVVAVKKAYSVLNQAYLRFVADYGEINPSLIEGSGVQEKTKAFGDMFIKYLNVQKNCGMSTDNDCFSTQNGGVYKFFNDTDWFNWNAASAYYKLALNDGSFVGFAVDTQFRNYGDGAVEYCLGTIHIDVNGDKGPNTLGKDVFSFWITKYGVIPMGISSDFATCRTNGGTCTAWVVTKGNMDYLRKDVSW